MSDLSAVLGNAGAPHQITHGDRTYTFSFITQRVKSAIEKRLYARAREQVYLDGGLLTPDERAAELEKARAKYERNGFSFYSEAFVQSLDTPKGCLLLLEVLTGETEEDVMTLLANRPEEVKSVLRVVVQESVAKLKKEAPRA